MFSRNIPLKEINRIFITLFGSPGTQLSIKIASTGSLAPKIIAFAVSPETVTYGETCTLSWETENAKSVSIDPDIGTVDANGTLEIIPGKTSLYTIVAEGPGGTASQNAAVTVTCPTPEVRITAEPENIYFGDRITLSWTSTNADTVTIDNGVGEVSATGRIEVITDQTTTYTIIATGPGGTATDQVTVTVNYVTPEVSLTATPTSTRLGGNILLKWTSTNATNCKIEPDIGHVALEGGKRVYPTQDTTYTITASTPDPNVTATASVSVTVYYPPKISLNVSKDVINYGDPVTLTWSAAPAQKVIFNNGIGRVATGGSMVLTPEYTTAYTLAAINTVDGDTMTTNGTIAVKVLGHPPELQPEGSFGEAYNDLIPEDAGLESYDPDRFVVITGQVNDVDGNPVQGVTASIIDHPEYGTALSDETGRYALPAEGGCLVKVGLEKPGYLTAHRKTVADVNDVVVMDTVTLLTRDPAATVINFDGNPDTILAHASTEVGDAFGTRKCTMIFTGDNRAYSVDKYGNILAQLPTITARATEYIIPESMPAILPPTSAYTYCVELEAEGYKRIKFDKPVTCFVDNFLGFDVGEAVPVGYYDRDKAIWVPSHDGAVVRLLDTDNDGIIDALDYNDDGLPDDLDRDGLVSDEVAGLAASCLPGDTCWRFTVDHFSPWDTNWSFIAPDDADKPNPDNNPFANDATSDRNGAWGTGNEDGKHGICEIPKSKTGSYVDDRSRVLHDDKPVFGTGLNLHYASDRTDGFTTRIIVPASGDTIPESLEYIRVILKVAGKTMETTLAPEPNQKAEFIWDGYNFRGREVNRSILATVRIGFGYKAVYVSAGMAAGGGGAIYSFARSGIDATALRTREEIILWKTETVNVTPAHAKTNPASLIADGWTISDNHYFNFNKGKSILHKGNGHSVEQNASYVITLIAGNGLNGSGISDDVQATEIGFGPKDVVADKKGNIYITASFSGFDKLLKIDNNGIVHTKGTGYNWGGGSLAMDSAENIYITGNRLDRVFKVDTNGLITAFAGNGYPKHSGDGGLAVLAGMVLPTSVAADLEGNVYICDSQGHRVRKVDPNGIISTVAGKEVWDVYQNGIPAIEAAIGPRAVATDAAGNFYFAETSRIRKVGPDGIIWTIAGTGHIGYSGDGGPAKSAELGEISDIAVDARGNIYLADSRYDCIRKINSSGLITTIVGGGYKNYAKDGELATDIKLENPAGIALDPNGGLLIVDSALCRVFRAGPPAIFRGVISDGEMLFPDTNGTGCIMDSTGIHHKTVDLETGVVLNEQMYDVFNGTKRLVGIKDQFNNLVAIHRHADGTPYSIESPDGVTTLLLIDADSHLKRITAPNATHCDFKYTDDGLISAKVEPNGNTFQYIYDETGRITDTFDEEGGHWRFAGEVQEGGNEGQFVKNDTVISTVTTGEGNTTYYEDTGDTLGRSSTLITDAAGGHSAFARSDNGLFVQRQTSCGMDLNFAYGLDPVYKNIFVKQVKSTTTSGLTRTVLTDLEYQDLDDDNVPDLITNTVTVNGKNAVFENDVLNSTRSVITAENRSFVSYYDPETLLTTSAAIPGLNATNYTYYSDGKLKSISTGSRQASFTYDADGYLDSVTDPKNLTTYFVNNAMGQVTHIDRPDGTDLDFSYDENGHMTVLANPSDVSHGFSYNKVNLPKSYNTPLSGSYGYIYDRDRRLIREDFPSGKAILIRWTPRIKPVYGRSGHRKTMWI